MNVLDLFSGIGGWTFGLEPAGMRVVCAVEAEPWKRAIHRAAWPGVPVFRDIRKVTGDVVRRAAGAIDLICGSPPCQDASAANTRGRGIDGAETGLFREAVRLVLDLRPGWVAFENSPRLRTRGVDQVLGWLEEAGYAVWPLVVGADDVGAPHERKRIWIVAHAPRQRRSAEGRRGREDHLDRRDDPARYGADADCGGLRQQSGRSDGARGADEALSAHAADADGEGQLERAFNGEMAWLVEHPWAGGLVRHLRVADGLSAGFRSALLADCRSAYGDAVVPQVVEIIGRAIMTAEQVTNDQRVQK